MGKDEDEKPVVKEKKAAKKEGKKPHVNKPTSKKYTHYSGKESKLRFCPRCGPGVFMANRGDRVHCGKCSYTEFSSKK